MSGIRRSTRRWLITKPNHMTTAGPVFEQHTIFKSIKTDRTCSDIREADSIADMERYLQLSESVGEADDLWMLRDRIKMLRNNQHGID